MDAPNIAVDHVKELFDMFDADGGGTIDTSELTGAFITLGIAEEEVEALVREIDTGSGEIDFEEFSKMFNSLLSQRDSLAEMHKAFMYFSDGKERITLNDLRQVSIDTNDVQKEQFLHEMFLIGDVDKDGVISFMDFKMMMERAIATEKEGITGPKVVLDAANERDGVKL
eukprot:GILI01023228.1.p1 GENE.GILI01023228.1~~GILI01023228.1.p1  ORF type:complete len:170 (-),score=52.85 GILI01023228.1:110-619(-)